MTLFATCGVSPACMRYFMALRSTFNAIKPHVTAFVSTLCPMQRPARAPPPLRATPRHAAPDLRSAGPGHLSRAQSIDKVCRNRSAWPNMRRQHAKHAKSCAVPPALDWLCVIASAILQTIVRSKTGCPTARGLSAVWARDICLGPVYAPPRPGGWTLDRHPGRFALLRSIMWPNITRLCGPISSAWLSMSSVAPAISAASV